MEILCYDAGEWGTGELWLEGGVLVAHELPRPDRTGPGSDPGHVLCGQMEAYFAGERVSFDDVRLDLEGFTPFQLAVTEALRTIPYGATVTYGELAALAGRPNAQRAAGTFCAHNQVPLVIPCHRVVAAGGIGSYGSLGIGYKRRLLALEGSRDV